MRRKTPSAKLDGERARAHRHAERAAILYVADEPCAGARVPNCSVPVHDVCVRFGEQSAGRLLSADPRSAHVRATLAVVSYESVVGARNPLCGSRVSDRSRCGAVQIHSRSCGWTLASFKYECSTGKSLPRLRLEKCNFRLEHRTISSTK